MALLARLGSLGRRFLMYSDLKSHSLQLIPEPLDFKSTRTPWSYYDKQHKSLMQMVQPIIKKYNDGRTFSRFGVKPLNSPLTPSCLTVR
jgi:hypothetical protein